MDLVVILLICAILIGFAQIVHFCNLFEVFLAERVWCMCAIV